MTVAVFDVFSGVCRTSDGRIFTAHCIIPSHYDTVLFSVSTLCESSSMTLYRVCNSLRWVGLKQGAHVRWNWNKTETKFQAEIDQIVSFQFHFSSPHMWTNAGTNSKSGCGLLGRPIAVDLIVELAATRLPAGEPSALLEELFCFIFVQVLFQFHSKCLRGGGHEHCSSSFSELRLDDGRLKRL